MASQEENHNENPLLNIIQRNMEDEKDKNKSNNKLKQNMNPIHQYFNQIQNNSSSNIRNKNQKGEDINYDELINGFANINLDDSSKAKLPSQKKSEQNNFFQNPMMNNNNKNNQKEMGVFNYYFGDGMKGGDISKKMGENPSFLGQLGFNNNNDDNDENNEENEEEKEENNNFKNNYKFENNNNNNNNLISQEKLMMMRNNNSNNNNFQNNNNNKMMMQMNNNNNNNNMNINNVNMNLNNNGNNLQYNNIDPRIRNLIQQNIMPGNNQNPNNRNNQQTMMNNFPRNQNNNKNRKKKNRGNKINNNNNVNIQNMNLIMNQQQLPYNYQYLQNQQNAPYIQNQSQQMHMNNQNFIPNNMNLNNMNNMNRYTPPQNQIMFPSGEGGYPPMNMIGMNMNQNNSISLDQFIARANTTFPGKFYVIKSIEESNILSSIRFKIWCSTIKGNQKLQKAYKEADKKYPIFLFFSVNGSGKFMGIALMNSDVEYKVNFNYWSQNDKWKGFFMVDWICIKDVPNRMFRSIINDLNENKPVTSSRDTQEICTSAGVKMLKVFRDYPQESTIFDSQNDIKYKMNQRDYGNNNNNLNMNMNMKNIGGNINNINNNINNNNMNYMPNQGNMMNMNMNNLGNISNNNMSNKRNNMNSINNLNNTNNIKPMPNMPNIPNMNTNINFNQMVKFQDNMDQNIEEEKKISPNLSKENNMNNLIMKMGDNLGDEKNEQLDLNNLLDKKDEEEEDKGEEDK